MQDSTLLLFVHYVHIFPLQKLFYSSHIPLRKIHVLAPSALAFLVQPQTLNAIRYIGLHV